VAADLRLYNLALGTDDEPELPAELMRPEQAFGIAAVFVDDEQFTEGGRRAVPLWALKDLHGRRV
jgi:hypothetical protein